MFSVVRTGITGRGKRTSEWRRAGSTAGLATLGLALLAGCHDDKPHEYGEQRGSLYDVDRGGGLQAKDVNEAADQMAADLLSDRNLNASNTSWTVVVYPAEDRTTDRMARVNYDIFLQALKDRLARQSNGRITLITNLARFRNIRAAEVEGGGPDPYGQGGAIGQNPTPAAINPDYALTGTVMDLPNRRTNYYQIEFSLEDLHARRTVWDRTYAVKVAR